MADEKTVLIGRVGPTVLLPKQGASITQLRRTAPLRVDVARVRAFRTQLNGATHRIVRGEFHRHTAISMVLVASVTEPPPTATSRSAFAAREAAAPSMKH